MKLTTFGNENAATAGASREIAITFQANAVAFYAQISGLAEDKVGYPTRELNTNAWDATRARYGTDVPEDRRPELILPTALNPVYRVRDYGFGMNQGLMETVYGQMYASTKRESTEEVGGWGIGRFSSFGYLLGRDGAASYRVTSIADEPDGRRLKTIWTVSISRSGTPVLRELMAVETTEETGLEVSFDVRREDIATFRARAQSILWSFQPRPRVSPAFDWAEPEIAAQGSNWTYYRGGTPFAGPHVRMGCVIYPIDLMQVGEDVLGQREPILIEAPIGSLSVSLSRESLAYDDRTVTTLRNLIAPLDDAFVAIVSEKVEAAESYIKSISVFEEAAGLFNRQKDMRSRVTWRGRRMLTDVYSTSECKFMHLRPGWETFDKFERAPARLGYLASARVVVEHRPFYSMERFDAAGLVGQEILWVRVKKGDLDLALDQLGNPEYVVLDDTKIDATPRQRDETRKMIRRRRVLDVSQHGASRKSVDIDLAAGGIFVTEIPGEPPYYRRRRDPSTYRAFGDHTAIEWSAVDQVVKECVKLELLPPGTKILLKTGKEQLGPNWVPLGTKVQRALRRRVNVALYTGLASKSVGNMSSDVRTIAQYWSFARGPEDLKAIEADAKSLYAQLQGERGGSSASDRAIAALKALGRPVELPVLACPLDAINARWIGLEEKYPIVEAIIYRSGFYDRPKYQTMLDDYFDLLAKAAQQETVVEQGAEIDQEPMELAEAA